jgi:Flp pilus assembly protein TadG
VPTSKHAGQSLVEFALSATLLLMLLLGTVDFARAYTAQVAIKNAVAEAGYYAAQNPDDEAGVKLLITSELSDFQPAVTTSNISVQCSGASGAEETTVSVAYNKPLLFNYVIPSATVTLASATTVPQMGGC